MGSLIVRMMFAQNTQLIKAAAKNNATKRRIKK
jgi:hypothetical protein